MLTREWIRTKRGGARNVSRTLCPVREIGLWGHESVRPQDRHLQIRSQSHHTSDIRLHTFVEGPRASRPHVGYERARRPRSQVHRRALLLVHEFTRLRIELRQSTAKCCTRRGTFHHFPA